MAKMPHHVTYAWSPDVSLKVSETNFQHLLALDAKIWAVVEQLGTTKWEPSEPGFPQKMVHLERLHKARRLIVFGDSTPVMVVIETGIEEERIGQPFIQQILPAVEGEIDTVDVSQLEDLLGKPGEIPIAAYLEIVGIEQATQDDNKTEMRCLKPGCGWSCTADEAIWAGNRFLCPGCREQNWLLVTHAPATHGDGSPAS